MAEYILVAEEEGEEPMEIPVEDDGTLLLSTLSAQFPGSCGLRFRNPESGAFRGVRVHEGRLHPPETQNDVPFVAVFPKCNPDAIIDNKRKGDQVLDNPTPKTKKLENIKCTDLIVLGLDYKTTEETMREYFSGFGRTVLCEIKKRQDNAQSRGFGFIKFTDYNMQRLVLGQRHEIDGRMCDVKIPASKETDEQSRRVFIGRVPETMKSDELRNYFKNYGEVTEVFIPKPFRPFAFVTFEDPEVAQSLCGEDHSINDTSLLVRSAAPRQGERSSRFNQGLQMDQRGAESHHYHRFGQVGGGGMRNMPMASNQATPSAPTQAATNYNTNGSNMNPFQMNQAFFAAALTQAAQQAAQAAQSQGTWQTQQAAPAQAMATDPQATNAAVQALINNTAAAANTAWAGMKSPDAQQQQQQQQAAIMRTQQQAEWDARSRTETTWN